MRLDTIDIRILDKLQAEGRISKVKLAEHVNLSTSACFDRIEKLIAKKLIKGYSAEIDVQKIIRTETVMTEITLLNHRAADFFKFETTIRSVPEVVQCYAVGGGIDYVVQFVVASIQHYQSLMDELLEANIGIDRYATYVVTKSVKRGNQYPIEHLLQCASVA